MRNDELLEKFKDILTETSDELSRTNSPNQIRAIDKKLVSIITQINSIAQEWEKQRELLLHEGETITEKIDASIKEIKLIAEYLREYKETIDKASKNIYNSVRELSNDLLDYKRLFIESQQLLKETYGILEKTRSYLSEIDEHLADIVQTGIEKSLNALEKRIHEILYDITNEYDTVAVELRNAREEFTQEVATLEKKLTEAVIKSVNHAVDKRLNEFISEQRETFAEFEKYLL